MLDSQTATQEAAQRTAQAGAGLLAAARAIAIQDQQRSLTSHARRVDDSHRAQMRALGMEDIADRAEPDDMGNIIVTGDINMMPGSDGRSLPWSTVPPSPPETPQPQEQTPASTQPAAQASGIASLVKPAAMIAAAATAGAAGPPIVGAVYDWATSDPPAAVQPAEPSPTPPAITPGGVVIEPFRVGP